MDKAYLCNLINKSHLMGATSDGKHLNSDHYVAFDYEFIDPGEPGDDSDTFEQIEELRAVKKQQRLDASRDELSDEW